MFKLHPYQQKAFDKIDQDLRKSLDPILLSAITGSGKTVILSSLVKKYFHENQDRYFLLLMHKQELVNQFYKTLQAFELPLNDIGICCASLGAKEIQKRITISTVQTFINQIDRYKKCSLLIIDEAHRVLIGENSQYDTVISHLQENNEYLRIIGCTSTPFRLGHGYIYGDKCTGQNLFQDINHQITYQELKDQGFLMPLEGEVSIDNSFNTDMDKVSVNGDYVLNQASDVMVKRVHLDTAIEGIKKHCADFKHICVFCCTIQHAEILKDMIDDQVEPCTIVHSQLTPIERDINMNNWKSGKIRIITSVNILVEGFDFPPLDCLVFARPTLSAVLYLQGIGRVLRIAEGKTRAFLLDLTNNTDRFGTDLDNVYVKVPRSVEKKIQEEEEKRLDKDCPECGFNMHKACIKCDACGYEYPETEYHSYQNTDTQSVIFGQEAPREYAVDRMEFSRHQKEGKPDSIKVSYYNHFKHYPIASEYLCFDHGGYATKKAHEWYSKMTDTLSIPESVDEALERIEQEVIRPDKILVGRDGKYKRVLEHIYDE